MFLVEVSGVYFFKYVRLEYLSYFYSQLWDFKCNFRYEIKRCYSF